MGSLLREAPAFRALWSSRAVSQVGDGVSRVALVLLVADRGPGAVGWVLLAATLPRLLGPLAARSWTAPTPDGCCVPAS